MAQEKTTAPAEAPERFPRVDRLIDLASDKNKKGSTDPGPADPKESRESSMWKLLLQLRPFLPYLARIVPMLDVAVAPLQSAGLSSDVRKAVAQSMADSVAKLESGQRELNTTVISALDRQETQLSQLEDQLIRLRQASENLAAAQSSLGEDLKSIARLLQIIAIGGAVLLIALLIMIGVLLAHTR